MRMRRKESRLIKEQGQKGKKLLNVSSTYLVFIYIAFGILIRIV